MYAKSVLWFLGAMITNSLDTKPTQWEGTCHSISYNLENYLNKTKLSKLLFSRKQAGKDYNLLPSHSDRKPLPDLILDKVRIARGVATVNLNKFTIWCYSSVG